jgi:HPt (histidine-containing phosphotransfer) domain-containing protein
MKTIQINEELLQNLYGGCNESLTEVFSEFISNYTEMKQGITSAYQSGDFIALKRQLHSNAPSFMYLGMPEVGDLFRRLEYKCNEDYNNSAIEENFSNLIHVIDECYFQATGHIEFYKKAV